MINTILFDLDGTLCDCTELHYVSLNKALKEKKYQEIDRIEHNNVFNGLPTNKKLEMLISLDRINKNDKKEIWDLKQKYTKETILEILKPDEEKIELHKYLKNNGINLACVTNSILETGKLILQTTGQLEFMDLIIANDLIKYPKPHSEGYIRAMIHFKSMPENVLIVEDSPVGIQSANGTGANVWEISNAYDVTIKNIKKYIGEK